MKLQRILFALIITSFMMSCNNKNTSNNKNGFSTITGTLDIPYTTEINLSKVEHGKEFIVSTSQLNADKQFGFSVNPEQEGFYIIGNKQKSVYIPIYVKGDQIFNIQYNTEGYELLESPDAENDVLYNWVKSNDTLKMFDFQKSIGKTYKDFFPFYEKFIPEMKKQHELVNTPNKHFNKLMHVYIDLNIENVGLNFVFTPRSEHPKREDMASFYADFMKGENFKSDIVLDLPNGINALRSHQMYKAMHTGADFKTKNYLEEMFKGIENDKLKGHLALEFLRNFKSYNEDYLSFIEPLREDIALCDYVVEEVDKFEIGIKTMSPGTQGYPFTYKDHNGKSVSFSDLKGKIVYIDVWATWCAPCKKEIPYLKQLEKDLHGKDIQFVSISMDKQKDHEKWKKFIKDKELTGLQLFSDDAFNTRIAKDYKINSIPRFLLFDKEGKIIDANAKRPSEPELKKQLLTLLK
ncbi:TlpA family protein disulfide reductase [Snuella sedimenti]|uniref:TlpA family protein disulfide reductase n=1 Tax=Snuella sedimenti TaxID=2798802 RepID=A0A8J7IP81_9FLAO|nr:TlpA disulfide reductase family protein [Snuella sedimenti]MBJ6368382.1 TlpA family protein disulfide reductase [Snuella sedimenti]